MKDLVGLLSGILLILCACIVALAGEEALYGPKAPAGSTFIRLFNASSAASVEARVGTTVLKTDSAFGAGAYAFLPAGSYELQVDGRSMPVTLKAGSYYTGVVLPDQLVLIQDPAFADKRKSLLVLYNLTPSDHISVKTSRKKKTVLKETGSMSRTERAVNPVRVALTVYDGDQLLARAPEVSFERGRMFSLFVCGSRTAPVVTWVENGSR